MDKFFRMPVSDVAGAVGFTLFVLVILAIATRVGPIKKLAGV